MKNIAKRALGFSLIELTVVVGLTGILAIAITAVSMTSLISSTRVRNLVRIRQAGDSSINQIQRLVRNARTLSSCNSTANTITTINEDGRTTIISLESNRIASNSGIYMTPADTIISAETFDITCLPNDASTSLIKVKFGITSTVKGTRSVDTPVINYETNIQLRN